MRTRSFTAVSLFLLAAGLAATPAAAQEEEKSDPVTISGGATLVSDYRFRGISQTDKRFAVQGSFTVAHESGLYGTIWGSSIDDYVYNGADQEIDFIVGFRRTFGDTTVDVGALYYYYPNSGGIASDFFEPFASVSHVIGPVTAKVSAAYAPEQAALAVGGAKQDNLYLAGDLTAAIPETPLSLTAHVGHSFGPSYLTIGNEYTDWSLGASVTLKNFTVGISYVDAEGVFLTPSGRDAAKGGLVGTVGVSF